MSAETGPVIETVTSKVGEMSIDFDDYIRESRAKYEGTYMRLSVHMPREYAKHLTLSSTVTIGTEVQR